MRVHIPTPAIETESVMAYSSDTASNLAFKVEEEQAAVKARRDEAIRKAEEMLGDDGDIPSNIRNMDDEHFPRVDVLMNRFLPVEERDWCKCLSCGYEKPMHTACSEPCV
jgi:hypothetical protein